MKKVTTVSMLAAVSGLLFGACEVKQAPAEVDLEEQTIKAGNYVVPFTIDPARRMRLLNGWDDLDLTATYKDKIEAFAARDKAERPWAVPAAG